MFGAEVVLTQQRAQFRTLAGRLRITARRLRKTIKYETHTNEQ